ncbi:MAG: lysozyme inhibitor LprI family protein [Defluviicoccus sp.]
MALALVAGLGTASVAAESPPQPVDSGCRDATAPVDLLICSDATLLRLTAKVNDAFAVQRERTAAASQAALVAGQQHWLQQRLDRCHVPAAGPALSLSQRWQAAPCLDALYRERLVALGGAAEPVAAVPAGDPAFIHPLCLDALLGGVVAEAEAELDTISLADCTHGNRHVPVSTTTDGSMSAAGAVAGMPTTITYRRVGRLPDGHEIFAVWSSAGDSGSFSTVAEVAREGDGAPGPKLRARALIDGGDRCDGGIAAVRLVDRRTLEIDLNVTAAAFLAVADDDFPEDIYADELLPCTECCFGSVRFRHDLGSGERTLVSGRLDRTAWDAVATSDTGGAVLACVRAAVAAVAPQLPHVFSVEEMRKLSQNVQQACPLRPGL